MTTAHGFLGWSYRRAATVGLTAAAVGLAVGIALPSPDADALRCASMNGTPMTTDACADYLAEVDAVADACGWIVEQIAHETCADDVLNVIRSGDAPCGVTVEVEDGVPTFLAASCMTADAMADVMADRLRSGRFAP
jgi:hypothetical protein